MSKNPYEALAATLDKTPNGFTHIEDGTHLRVLEWIFTPEEAELASQMKMRGETAEELARRLGISGTGLVERLETMAKKGQIRVWDSSTGRRYSLIVFIGGIWENQMDRADPRFAALMEQYFRKGRGKGLFDTNPAIFRVIPINRAVSRELEVYPFEVAEKIIAGAKSWGVRDCACKRHKATLGEDCKYPTKVCLMFSPNKENAYAEDEFTRPISKDDALKILHDAEEAGLVHCSMNIQHGHSYICNCCTCCCTMLRGAVEMGQPLAFMRSNFVTELDTELCTGCGSCVSWCQFHALELQGEVCDIDTQRCVGCGVCSVHCPENALRLVSKSPKENTYPPKDRTEWMTQKVEARGVDYSDLI